jgi:hypothetical protein
MSVGPYRTEEAFDNAAALKSLSFVHRQQSYTASTGEQVLLAMVAIIA